MATARPQRFEFETSFDADRDGHGSHVTLYTRSEVAAAAEAAFADGRAAGAAEAEQLAGRTLAAISRALTGLRDVHVAAIRQANRDAVTIAVALVKKLLPSYEREGCPAEIEAIVAHCLARRAEEPRIVVRVAESQLDPLGRRIDALAQESGFGGKIVLLAEPGLAPSDCRVEWADG
ncbi:MAG: hypothetical protein ACREGL_05935, partial [Alphaproteobacteria bacterium]